MISFGVRLMVLLWCGMAARAELPVVWKVRTAPVTNGLNGVAFCEGTFLAVGSGATILTSPGGIKWTARSAGTNTAPLYCAAYGNGLYVAAGGEGHAVILASTDGFNWFNAPAPVGAGPVYGINFLYNQFVAVGRGAEANTSSILTSSNGLDWAAQAVPTGYALYDVSPPAAEDGLGWADYLYVAVGDHGTILTSSNGFDWVLRDSGATAPLRSVAWQGGLLAGGGSGVVLSSSDGFSWTPAAPAPMDVRGLATSFAAGAVVAVGNYTTSGRLHASVDGLSWPGNPLLFPQPLNSVAYGGNSFVAVGNGGLILQAVLGTLAVTNEWTKAISGEWQEPYWSLGVLPSAEQGTVAIRNPGWKALAIDANTRAYYPDSLTVANLIVDAPSDSSNQLLLNWAGLEVPLKVLSDLTIGPNGSLASHHSALQAANAYIDGEASFMDYATEEFGQIWLRSGATLGLTNGIMTSSNLTFYDGTFTQSGGSHLAQNVSMVAPPSMFEVGYGAYYLQGGVFGSKTLGLGEVRRPFAADGHGLVVQTGGVHTNSTIYLRGYYSPHGSFPLGAYVLEGGLLATDLVSSDGGFYSQSGGTNMVQRFDFTGGAGFRLTGGDLITSNTVIYVDTYVGGICIQTGGRQIVRDRLLVRGRGYDYTDYSFEGGSVVASNLQISSGNVRIHSNAVCSTSRIDMDSGARLYVSAHGIVSNTGIIAIAGRGDTGLYTLPDLRFYGTAETQHLGRLQVLSGALLDCNGAAPVRFADSHTMEWTGRLLIRFPGPGSDTHVFFGTNALGLSPAQLAQTEFQNGFNGMKYAAMLLPTGELVPVAATNSWTKGGSGYWEEPYWSLGRLPGAGEALVLIDNAGSKTVTIGRDTAATYPQSLSLSKLMIDGPAGTLNQLALVSAGLDLPLRLRWDLIVGTNGSLVSDSSALQIPNTYIDGSAWLSNGSLANLENLWLRSGAEMNLTGASRMNSSNLTLSGGTFTQSGGTLAADYVNLSGPFSATMTPSSTFVLRDGVLTSRDMDLDSPSKPVGSGRWAATLFWQFAGIHTNSHMELWGSQNANGGTAAGTYRLDGGLLVSESVAGYAGVFIQRGGTHIVQSSLQIGYLPYDGSAGGGYELSGGALRTASLSLAKAELRLSGVGSVSNTGWLTLAMGAGIVANGAINPQQLGALQVYSDSYLDLHAGQPTNATVLRFGDSQTRSWFGSLQIRHWGLNSGDHIFFGTNAQALTEEQLSRISFTGNATNYPATLLKTGELAPAVPPSLTISRTSSALILSWPGPYELLTATNATGPYALVAGATSPATTAFSERERYFRLRVPIQSTLD